MENISEEFAKIFEGVNASFNTKTCVGEPIKVNDTTIIPLVELTVGAGVGEFEEKEKKAGGFGAKVTPVACLVVQNGFTKLVNIKDNDAITKLLDMVPDIIDKLTGKELPDDVRDAIDNIDEEYIENV